MVAGLSLSVLVVIRRGWDPWLPPTLVLAAISPYLVYTDVRWRRLPNRVLGVAFVLAVFALAAAGISCGDGGPAARALVCGAIAGTVAGAAAIAGPAFGGGDAKLIGLMAVCLGVHGAAIPMAAVLFGFLAAGVWAVGSFAARPAARRRTIPLGPFLTLGAVLATCLPLG